MINKWHSCFDNSGVVGTILMDLSKTFDCLPHEPVLAKLHAYEVDIKSLKLLQDYLSNRTQRAKLDSTYLLTYSLTHSLTYLLNYLLSEGNNNFVTRFEDLKLSVNSALVFDSMLLYVSNVIVKNIK